MALATGTRLGPYEIVELLGSGGMGEVYRARDPRLGREVAVKVLRAEVAGDAQRLARFEREARAVAALNHPNILTVHDVGTHDGAPYVVTELLEGENLRELVSRRSPTQKQILGYALQVARGLEAAHAKDIVHRDLKPENLFLTTDGRVKILDFGLAKLRRDEPVSRDSRFTTESVTGEGHVLGTVAYMSPEQARGQAIDARSDVFSFGVVLHELLAGRHPFRRETAAATLTAIVEETPAELERLSRGIPPAVGGIVRRCLEKAKEERYASGHEIAVILEAVLAAPAEAVSLLEVEERSPYPGLSAFTERDAGVFFGREREVAELWGRIRNRKLLAVIGPSGVGKTSFLRAGVMASRPEGWAAVHATPGSNPALGLARAVTPELAGDAEAIGELLGGVSELGQSGEAGLVLSALKRWRSRHAEALLVVDQFEELFTLNPPEVQVHFASLLRRLASETDVHVVLSLRDDFLIRCSDHEPLAPVFESLTPLTALTRDGLRSALVEPANKHHYRFEDDAFVDEMVSTVEGVRGALPLLAFAVARLWEKRDRERKLLTREAYREIAGVEGALAQHAEAVMDAIGPERQSLVRETFRNLVTAQGTRAAIDREELLSAFPDRSTAQDVLRQLIDARLLTSYDVEGKHGEPSHHRIEVVHESLLKAWPRLVRWQAQDEEGAVLRDQLKQAAHLWEERGRTPDLLWSGTAYRELELWRERYTGALTALEEDFARAVADRAQRQVRRRRAVAGTVVVAALVVAAVTGVLWQRARSEALRAEAARERAAGEALRAEASKLLALAQLRLEDDPTEALAFTTASLDLADTREARIFAIRALWEAPPALELAGEGIGPRVAAFSPDGRWLAAAGNLDQVGVWAETGERVAALPGHHASASRSNRAEWSSHGWLVTGRWVGHRLHVWSVPGGSQVRTIELGGESFWHVYAERLFAETVETGTLERPGVLVLRSWRLPDGGAEALGRVDRRALGAQQSLLTPNGWLYARGTAVYLRPLPAVVGARDRLLTRHGADVAVIGPSAEASPGLMSVYSRDRAGETREHSFPPTGPPTVRTVRRPETAPQSLSVEPSGRWFRSRTSMEPALRLWSRTTWPAARPLVLRRNASWFGADTALHPTGDWAVASTADMSHLTFWPLRRPCSTVVSGYDTGFKPLAFSPDSRWLATSWSDGKLRLWPVAEDMEAGPRVLDVPERQSGWTHVAFAPDGRHVSVVGWHGRAYLVPLDGSPARRLEGFSDDIMLYSAAVSPSGRLVAAAPHSGQGDKTLRVWNWDTGAVRQFALPSIGTYQGTWKNSVNSVAFADESTLLTAGEGGVVRWNLDDGSHELVFAAKPGHGVLLQLATDRQTALATQTPYENIAECGPAELIDVRAGTARPLPEFGDCISTDGVAIDASGSVGATAGLHDGLVRVGRLNGGEPHLLAGHEGAVYFVTISPDLRWVASAGNDGTLRLWPMPDLDAPPLHSLPREQLLARLHSLTNLRAVRDPAAPDSWKIEVGPFPGWKDVPAW